jgi:uncharacterized membrane protein
MRAPTDLRSLARWTLAAAMAGIGVLHFVAPAPFVAIVPRSLPAPQALVYISGACEVLGGIGLLVPYLRRAAGWGLITLYIAVFPANINMAVNNMPIMDEYYPRLLWARLPLQAVFIAWAWWCSQPDPAAVTARYAERGSHGGSHVSYRDPDHQ